MTRWFDLTLPPDVRYIGVARSTVVAAAETTGLDAERVQDLRTCVSEAVTNAVTAHRRHRSEDSILLRIGCGERDVRIEVHDLGPGMARGGARVMPATDDPDELAEGGYGLPVIQALADEMELAEGADSGTIMRLRFTVRTSVDG